MHFYLKVSVNRFISIFIKFHIFIKSGRRLTCEKVRYLKKIKIDLDCVQNLWKNDKLDNKLLCIWGSSAPSSDTDSGIYPKKTYYLQQFAINAA